MGSWSNSASTTATLRYRHVATPGSFPFFYEAEQRFALDAGGLTIAVSVTNRGDRPMPAGIGVHPYFAHRRGLRLELAATGMWSRHPLDWHRSGGPAGTGGMELRQPASGS